MERLKSLFCIGFIKVFHMIHNFYYKLYERMYIHKYIHTYLLHIYKEKKLWNMWNTQRILRAGAGLVRSTCCGTVVDHVEQLWNTNLYRNGVKGHENTLSAAYIKGK